MSTILFRFAALADPVRCQIVETLAAGELAAGELVRLFSLSQPAISHHLRALRKANLVHVRVHGQQRLYSLDPIGFNELGHWLAHMEGPSASRLTQPEQTLRIQPATKGSTAKKRKSRKKSRP